jgi:glutaminyl-peptide cyclotransferase
MPFSGEGALAYAATLMQFGPRVTGGEANLRAGDWLLARMAAMGWATFTDEGAYEATPIRNIVGRKGTGPVVILAAHYDSRRRADRDPQSTGEPVPGANDSASGVAVLLELARSLTVEPTGHQIWLALLDAEDNGGLDGWDWAVGAEHLAARVERDRSAGAVFESFLLLDMVGDCDQKFYYEGNSDPRMQERIWAVAADLGYQDIFIRSPKYTMEDDHLSFRALGIPAVDMIDFDYPYWHTRADTLDKICAASLERVGRTVGAWVNSLARVPSSY